MWAGGYELARDAHYSAAKMVDGVLPLQMKFYIKMDKKETEIGLTEGGREPFFCRICGRRWFGPVERKESNASRDTYIYLVLIKTVVDVCVGSQ